MAKRKSLSTSKPSDGPSQEMPAKLPKSGSAEIWSKSKKKRMRRLRGKEKHKKASNDTGGSKPIQPLSKISEPQKEIAIEIPSVSTAASMPQFKKGKTSTLQQSFLARLSGSRFRELNEELYTTTSSTAFSRFSERPDLYEQYHDGFRHQVEQWPVNPVQVIFKRILSNYSNSTDEIVVADFGCGDAELAKKLLKKKQRKIVIHSFDLVACCDLVTACDMANVPLDKKTVDVGVFCLSLMGTNLADFIREAHRVLKDSGRLVVAEVRSRFATDGTDELQDFINALNSLGFSCKKVDKSNKMFVVLELEKNSQEPDVTVTFTAKPCIYKRR